MSEDGLPVSSDHPGTLTAVEAIDRLKARFGVATDVELAEKLSLGRSTVASWRKRDQVPARFVEAAKGGQWGAFSFAYEHWTEIEKRAMQLALLRLMWRHGRIATDYRTFLEEGGVAAASLWKIHAEATRDLAAEVDRRDGADSLTALQLLVYREFDARKDGA